jgi:hypothetical protein
VAQIADIGTAVTAEEIEPDTFTWYGQQFRTNPEFSELDYVDFAEVATEVDERDPRAAALLKTLLRSQIHPADFDAFWKHTKRAMPRSEGQNLARLTQVLMEAFAARPTGVPSDSSSGQTSTGTPLKEGSSSLVSPLAVADRLTTSDDPKLARVVGAIGATRPDLTDAVLRAHENRLRESHAG